MNRIAVLEIGFESKYYNHLEDAEEGYVWTLNGGTETLRSYGVLRAAQEPDVMQMEHLRKELIRAMPAQHYQFLRILSPRQIVSGLENEKSRMAHRFGPYYCGRFILGC